MLVKKCRRPGNLRYNLHSENQGVEGALPFVKTCPVHFLLSKMVREEEGKDREKEGSLLHLKSKSLRRVIQEHISPFDEIGPKNNFERMMVGKGQPKKRKCALRVCLL